MKIPLEQKFRILILAATMTLAAACQKETATAPASPPPAEIVTPDAAASLDHWLGQWNGPEGTFMKLDSADAGYAITIQNLDGPTTYQGVGAGDHIEFQRDGKTESIHATDGKATGMKWLADKTNCLTLREGEGYCRD